MPSVILHINYRTKLSYILIVVPLPIATPLPPLFPPPTQPPEESEHPLPMEYLAVNDGWGQSYGYVLYRTLLPADSKQVTIHDLRDYGVVRKYPFV